MIERLESAFPYTQASGFCFKECKIFGRARDLITHTQASERAHTSDDPVAFLNKYLNGGRQDHVHSRAEFHQPYALAQKNPVAFLFPQYDAPRKHARNLTKHNRKILSANGDDVLLILDRSDIA